MLFTKKKIGAVLLSASLIMSFTTSVFAEELGEVSEGTSTTSISEQELQNVKANFAEMGIDEETQSKLIEKLIRGGLIDSLNPEKQSLGVTSTTFNSLSSSSEESKALAGYTARTVYPDGSVRIQSVTPGPGSACGSGYCNIVDAKVEDGNGVVTASFLADYSIVNQGYDSITRVSTPQVKTHFGGFNQLKGPTIARAKETSNQSARAQMSWVYNPAAGSATQYLFLDVQNDSAKSRFDT
ncbi:hypothetical protein OIN60_20665 [Paenibacillus sp. P96]|uniref:DUF4879 domain-containing protein n=1 Tax=Paenibacillus zeirhizosphaerae TaxID=2987519 RepID=A0ABT9FWM6_9BACL|nr:hypothetical protein [Paenibacillus sp. P96]MDP4099136.1 hypothetical protein [Paenibacillus sp. P96]